jgi:hypothetical protein
MFIALQQQYLCAPAERHVLWRVAVYMPLLTERDRLGIWGYKHIAPPEQEPLDTVDQFSRNWCECSGGAPCL